jgi:hypothetical protein
VFCPAGFRFFGFVGREGRCLPSICAAGQVLLFWCCLVAVPWFWWFCRQSKILSVIELLDGEVGVIFELLDKKIEVFYF